MFKSTCRTFRVNSCLFSFEITESDVFTSSCELKSQCWVSELKCIKCVLSVYYAVFLMYSIAARFGFYPERKQQLCVCCVCVSAQFVTLLEPLKKVVVVA